VTELLERLGYTVEFPQGQTCCGQMHFNTGYRPETLPMVRRFAEVFGGYEAVVTPSGSCAGMVREHHRVVAARHGDDGFTKAVEQVVPTVYELSDLLVDVLDVLGVTDVGAFFPHRVTYHPTCHSLRMVRVGDRPLTLLRAWASGSPSGSPHPGSAPHPAPPPRPRQHRPPRAPPRRRPPNR
jgi:Fe-S oxidoreductase